MKMPKLGVLQSVFEVEAARKLAPTVVFFGNFGGARPWTIRHQQFRRGEGIAVDLN